MGLFLVLMYLLSLLLGYASALQRSMRAISESLPESSIGARLLRSLNPLWQRIFLCATWALSFIALGYAFWKYGAFPGTGIAVCFMIAYRVSRMLLLHKLPEPFHLKLILNAVISAHNQCLKIGDAAGASSMETLFQKVGLELYARKLMRAASRAPKYLDRCDSSKLKTAKADNYHRVGERQRVAQREEDHPQLR
jgi:hypothetical protein